MYASLFYCGGSVMGEARPEQFAVHLKDAWEWFNARMGQYFAQRTVQGYKDRHFGLCALLWLVILRAGLSYLPQFTSIPLRPRPSVGSGGSIQTLRFGGSTVEHTDPCLQPFVWTRVFHTL